MWHAYIYIYISSAVFPVLIATSVSYYKVRIIKIRTGWPFWYTFSTFMLGKTYTNDKRVDFFFSNFISKNILFSFFLSPFSIPSTGNNLYNLPSASTSPATSSPAHFLHMSHRLAQENFLIQAERHIHASPNQAIAGSDAGVLPFRRKVIVSAYADLFLIGSLIGSWIVNQNRAILYTKMRLKMSAIFILASMCS